MRKLHVLPAMKCDSGCGLCCGIAPATKTEFNRVLRYIAEKDITPIEQGFTCPFYQNDTCAIYEVRPLSCELFGHAEKMTCPKGYNVNVEERQIQRMVRGNGPVVHVLHEAIPGWKPERLASADV